MATGSVSITITVPSLNGAGGSNIAGASNALAVTLMQQAAQAIGASGTTSGSIVYPPGSATIVGTWSYTPAS